MPSLAFQSPPPSLPAVLAATVDPTSEMSPPLSDPMPPPLVAAVLSTMWLFETPSEPNVSRIPPPSPLSLELLTSVPLPRRTVTPASCGATDPRSLVCADDDPGLLRAVEDRGACAGAGQSVAVERERAERGVERVEPGRDADRVGAG